METLRLAHAHGGTLRAPGIGPLWRICSRLCELQLLEAWGSQLSLTPAGRELVLRGRKGATGAPAEEVRGDERSN